jgi:5'-3' exonuclease
MATSESDGKGKGADISEEILMILREINQKLSPRSEDKGKEVEVSKDTKPKLQKEEIFRWYGSTFPSRATASEYS